MKTTTTKTKERSNFFKASLSPSSFSSPSFPRRSHLLRFFMVNFSSCMTMIPWTLLFVVSLFVIKTTPVTAIVNHRHPKHTAAPPAPSPSSLDYMDVDYYENTGMDEAVESSVSSSGLPSSSFASSGILVEGSNGQMFPYKEINFISPSQELAQSRWWYEGHLSFSAKGMDHLYLLNNFLMDLIQPSGLPDEIIKDQLFTDPIPLLNDNRQKV